MQLRRNQIILFVSVLVAATTAWWYFQGREAMAIAQFMRRTARLRDIQLAARLYDVNTGGGYPHLMAELIDRNYLEPAAFGLPPDWSAGAADSTMLLDGGRVQKVGDFWFAPLRQPARSGDIVFGWARWEERDEWALLYEDGHFESIHGDPSAAFEREAASRQRLGLPAYSWNPDL